MQEGALPYDESLLNSTLSFVPLVNALKKNIEEGSPGMKKLYGQVLREFESHPELMQTITNLDILFPHSDLIEELLAAVFPPTTANHMYGISIPFKHLAVYASPRFKSMLKPGTNQIMVPDGEVAVSLNLERFSFAYGLILKKYLGVKSHEFARSIHPYVDEETGLTRYLELRIDARFIDVRPIGEMPALPQSILNSQTNNLMTVAELAENIPIDKFVFEGISVLRVNDVTEQEVITRIKNRLLDINAFSNATVYTELEKHVQDLIGLKDLEIGITPFFKINGHYVYSDLHNNNSILFKHFQTSSDKDEISDYCKLLFRESKQPLLFDTLDEESLADVKCLQYYHHEGARSLILCPLKNDNGMLGMLEIMSRYPGQLKPSHISNVEPALALFALGLEKSLERLNSLVDTVIKKKFTAVQPAVEWKFTEAALNYIVSQQVKEEIKIDRIAFNDVHPIYGAIDIRGSSTQRSKAIQEDILEQLRLASNVIKKAQGKTTFPLLQEIEFKIDKFIESASDVLQSGEELGIQDFLQGQLIAVLNHLHSTEPSLKNEVEQYFSALDPHLGMLYHHRKEYEESVSKINDTLARFIDKEQAAAQKVYPHYFERYVTDGLEFNIYMGQAISPRKKFDEIYLRNLRMWQLTVLTKAARVTHALERELSHKLRTTQLILSHGQTLSILFRTEERKFDVDGAYNIRYEIVKKRIDKAHIKNSNERLTQPGKIAIVYSQNKDAEEYTEYIEFLQNKNLLKPGIEHLDLEELQGVIGLRALRVDVNFDDMFPQEKKLELSGTTSDQLLNSK
jgi:GAF domain-containing protein